MMSTRLIADASVPLITVCAFYNCEHFVSVIMGDDAKRIEHTVVLGHCNALRSIFQDAGILW